MSWLQRIIDRDPNDAVTVPDDPEMTGGIDPGLESPLFSEVSVSPVSPPDTDAAPCPDIHTRTGKSIFIVEDEVIVANDIKETLKNLGYDVTGIAKSGEDALEKVEELRPDLVLMDIHLATAMDGIEAAGIIHTRFDIPVIYLTAYADKALLDRAKVTEPFGYVIKPFDERELQSTIEIAFYKHKHDLQIREAYGELELRIAERTKELDQINQAMAESEQQYRSLFDEVPIGLYRTTPLGRFLDINPALVSLLGYPNREMLMNVSGSDIYVDPRDRNRWLDLIKREGIVRDFTVRFRKYDGTIIWVRDTGKAVYDDSGHILYYNGNVEDITERKQAEEALKQSERRLIDIVEHLPDATFAIDRNGTVIAWNRVIEEMTGVNKEAIIGKGNYEYALPFYGAKRPILIDWILNTGNKIDPREYQNIKKIGQNIYAETKTVLSNGKSVALWGNASPLCDINGNLIGAIESIRDVTEQKQVEEALQESEQRYRDVVEDQTEFICRFLPDGRLTFINEAYCSYFRLNREEIIGKPHFVVLLPDDARLVKTHLAALTPENPVAVISHRIVMPSGEVCWQRWSDRAIFDNEGDVIEYQSVGRDITSQKEAEIQLKNYKETLEQQVRDRTSELSRTNLKLKKEIEDRKIIQKKLTQSSNEKDLLIREIHHRVKNNLQLIIGLIDMTKTRAHEPIVVSTLTDIMTKVQTMGSIHTRLYESKRFDKINMRKQVHDLVEMISGFYDHDHLDIVTNIDCAEIYLPVDQAIPCALALNEIISNIHKHAFKGRRNGLVEISLCLKENLLRFVIQDNGVGLPSGFDIEKSNRLGLRLMRTLVEQQLHGNVQITSKNGTEVVIEFCIR